MEEKYYTRLALARIRGYLIRHGYKLPSTELLHKDIDLLTKDERKDFFTIASEFDIKLYYFKRQEYPLPRVMKVLGILKSLYFESLLDVGSGRGAFLFPLLDQMRDIRVSSLDILDKRYSMLHDTEIGGIDSLSVYKESICQVPFPSNSFDVVCMLEVLEHIEDLEGAVANAMRIAKKYIIASVPSKRDDNPEHINFLTRDTLTGLFTKHKKCKISFDEVPEHLIALIQIGE